MKRIWMVGVLLTVGSLLALAMPGITYASHTRPQSATPVTDQLVPAFDSCGAPNGTHNAPITVPSCPAPATRQTSNYLTGSYPDSPLVPYIGPALLKGTVIEKVTCLDPLTVNETGQTPPCGNPGDQQDIKITVNLAGVKCFARPTVSTSGCAGGGGSSYNGQVLLQKTIKMTDHDNSTNTSCSPNCPATTITFPATWGVQCASGTCNVVTSYDNVFPASAGGWIKEGKRAVIAESQVEVYDAGSAGTLPGAGPPVSASCPPGCGHASGDTLFLEEGLFAP